MLRLINDRLSRIACKSGSELALHTPSHVLLCFLWTACSLPGSFQLGRYAILPRSHDWRKLHWARSAWRSLPKKQQVLRPSRWNHGSDVPYIFQNYCMFKTSTDKTKEGTVLRTYIIQISFCQFQWFIVHKKKSSTWVSTFTKSKPWTGKPNSTP